MSKRATIISLIAFVVVAVLAVWIYSRLTRQEMDVDIVYDSAVVGEMLESLEGRTLVFTTNANVPLQIEWGGEGYSVLQMIGVPEQFRPGDISVGRRPVRDEFNIAMMVIGGPGEISDVEYLTENDGSWHKPQISAFADYVVATKFEGEKQNIALLDLEKGTVENIAPSHSISRWPSITEDGKTVMFHSFRDGSSYGGIFTATRLETESTEWEVDQILTDENWVFEWPVIMPDGSGFIVCQKKPDSDTNYVNPYWFGRRADHEVPGGAAESFHHSGPIGLNPIEHKHPSGSRDGTFCWNSFLENIWKVILIGDGMFLKSPGPDTSHPGHGWVQPYISPDGRFVVFIDDNIGPGTDRIGIYDLGFDEVIFIEGCGGNVMFPSISDPPVN